MIGMLPFLSRRGMADAAAENTAIGRSRIFDNVAGLHGGGVDSRGDGPLVIDETTIRNNRAADGGGITHAGDAAIRVLRSTLNANQATNGGGLFVDANSDTTLENTTVSGNTATGAGGGALTGSKLVLVHTTVAENNAGEGGGVNNGGAGVGTGAVIPRNTIVANNPTGGNCVGPVGSEGGNLENTDSCQLRAEGDKINTDPRIGQLADNGGPTRTHALLTLSPAQNNANGLPVPPGDQRSVPRPQGFAPDIGSFESTQPGCTGTLRVTANQDSWVNQGDRNKNLGTDAVMKVTSKSGGNNTRALVHFPLPNVGGCQVVDAELRMNSAGATVGRTIQALRVTGGWTESTVTWNNQPTTTGPAALTVSGLGILGWNVTTQVQAQYTGANDGFLFRDAVEGSAAGPEQQHHAREKGELPPQLVIRFG